jgi:type II secretory pathway component PulF
MSGGWKVFWLAVVTSAVAFAAAQLLVPDVVPIGYQEEAQPSWAVLTAFVLRAIELVAAWVAAIALAVMGGVWTRQWLRRDAH